MKFLYNQDLPCFLARVVCSSCLNFWLPVSIMVWCKVIGKFGKGEEKESVTREVWRAGSDHLLRKLGMLKNLHLQPLTRNLKHRTVGPWSHFELGDVFIKAAKTNVPS